jgi:anti-sigma28 factor (negative regulator of flagellin synthesis)
VELSGTAQAFLRLRPQLDGAAGTMEREARITHLRDEIASGGYRVNGEQIAAAMLRDDAIAAMLGFPRR